MIAPYELKNKTFSRTVRGYNADEVDEHIEFLIDTYTDLYKENDELTRRIDMLENQLEQYQKDSEAIRTALLNAQKVSKKIIDDANEKSKVIIKSVKETCDSKLKDIQDEIKRECRILNTIKGMNEEYKNKIKLAYTDAIETLSGLPDIEGDIRNSDDEIKGIVLGVKEKIEEITSVKYDPDDYQE